MNRREIDESAEATALERAEAARERRRRIDAVIADRFAAAFRATEPAFHGVGVHHLFGDRYRVNVLVEGKCENYRYALLNLRIAKSFFCRVTDQGDVIASEPALALG